MKCGRRAANWVCPVIGKPSAFPRAWSCYPYHRRGDSGKGKHGAGRRRHLAGRNCQSRGCLESQISQYFAALTNMRSVGVMGDERTYDYAIALRAVTTTDFMTAESAEIPWSVLQTVTSRIVNEVKHVNRVLYDCTGKPPATIEFE